MKPTLDIFEYVEHKQIWITVDTAYGGDIGQAIRYNADEKIWELVYWDCSDPRVINKSHDPIELIKIAETYT